MTYASPALQPIYNSAIAYKQGGKISVASNTTLTIETILTRDFLNSQDINIGSYFGAQTSTTLNSATVGLNGIDTGTLGASKVYAVYAIMDQAGFNPSGFILSLNQSTPIFPSGVFNSNYSSYVRIGWAVTDASSHFMPLKQSGNGSVINYTYDSPIQVLSSGIATVQTALTLTSSVPSVDGMMASFGVNLVPAAAGRFVSLCTSAGTIGVSQNLISGQVATVAIRGNFEIPVTLISGVPKIDYAVSNADSSASIWVTGFSDYLL